MENKNKYSIETLAVHAGYSPESEHHCTAVPIYQSNAYTFESVEYAADLFALRKSGNIYTRLTNPTVAALEERVNAMEGGVGAVAFASGHAAIFSTVLNLAGAGDEIVSSLCIYGGAINLLKATLGNCGVKTIFVSEQDEIAAWESVITPKTKALFVEVVGNPNANVADIPALAQLAKKHGIPLIVDSTFTTPFLIRPLELGADIVIHSATKFLCGNGTSMAGIVVDGGSFAFAGNDRFPQYNRPDESYHGVNFGTDVGNAGFITRLRTLLLRDVGACLSPFNAFLCLSGIETLHLRMRRHCDNALAVAQYLAAKPEVSFVNYPLLTDNKYYDRAKKYLPNGVGSVFTFGLRGGREAGVKFIEALELIALVANVGDAKSLVIHPATTTHSQLTDDELARAGISAETVRLSVGIENAADIIADIDQAIAKAVGK